MSTPAAIRPPPFPFQGTLSIEGVRINTPSPSDRGLLTLPRQPISDILRFARTYLSRFESKVPKQGQVLMVRGEHGTGKTHALRYLMQTAQREASSDSAAAVHQIYVKAEGPDFVKLYQEAAALVPAELLRDLSLRFLGVMATEQLQRSTQATSTSADQSVREGIEKRLRHDPQRIYQIFNDYQVEAGAAEERRAEEVDRVAGGVRDFNRALSYLLSSELSTAAYDWLVGRPVTPDQMERLGVAGPITSPVVAKWALQLLLTLFARAGRPLILYIDQCEKLVIEEGRLMTQNAGLLHTLVEFAPRTGCMLVVCGSNNAWWTLPPDLRQRFGANVVELPVLKLQEAKDLVRLYQTPPDQPFEPGSTADDDLFPFNDAAIRQIMSFSGGNLRRFLQICAQVWELCEAGSKSVSPAIVETVVKQISATAYFDERTVSNVIATLLKQRGLIFSEGVKLGGGQVAFAVRSPPGTLRLLVDVKHAFFHYDEARRALESLDLRAQLAKEKIPAQYVLVVLGYVSPEIVAQVRTFVDELVIYEPDSFRPRFEIVLDQVLATRTDELRPPDELERQLAELRVALEQIIKIRNSDADVIEQRISKLLDKQSVDQLVDRQRSAREAWSNERKQIEERIRGVRRERASAEFEDVRRLVASAVTSMTRRHRLMGVISGLYFAVICFYFVFTAESLVAARYLAFLTAAAVLGLFSLLPEIMRAVGFPTKYALQTPPNSLEELDRMARDIAKHDTNARELLQSQYPQRRYAGTFITLNERELEALPTTLSTEPSAVVRRAIAKRIGQEVEEDSIRTSMEWLITRLQSIPEVAYSLETLAVRGMYVPELQLPAQMATMMAIAGAPTPPPRRASLAYELAIGLQPIAPSGLQKMLAEAFEQGPDRYTWPDPFPFGRQSIVDALAELSPFDAGGLGTFDELQNIKRIDQFYLFFRHLEFLLERDLIVSSPAQTLPRRKIVL